MWGCLWGIRSQWNNHQGPKQIYRAKYAWVFVMQKSASLQDLAPHATSFLKLQKRDLPSARFSHVDNKNQNRIPNWQNRWYTVSVITSAKTEIDAIKKHSGMVSKIFILGVPLTAAWFYTRVLSSRASSTKSQFNQYEAIPVCFDTRHRTLNILLISDSQKQRISLFRSMNLRNTLAEANPARKGPSQRYRHGRNSGCTNRSSHSGPHQGKRGQYNTIFVETRKPGEWGFTCDNLTEQTSSRLQFCTIYTHEKAFVEKYAFWFTSAIVALFSKPTYEVRIQVGHCPNQL